MKRHEYWRHQYRKNRYLRHLSDEELHQRGRDVFNINLTLTLENKIGLLSIQDFGYEAMERWTHYLEECNLRGFGYEDGMKQMRVKDSVPDLLGDLGKRASAALQAEGDLKTAQLLKFGKAKYLTPLIEEGKLRIQPASSFSDPLHNAAVGDNETTRSFKMAISGERILDLVTEHGLPREMADRDDLEIDVQYFTDYWMTCFGRALQPRMAVDFEADSMVAVLDKDEFYRRLRRAFREKMDYSSMKHGPVQYFDPYLPNCNFETCQLALVELPFAQDAFFAVFGRYNTAVWPLIPIFYLLGAASVALLFRPSRAAAIFISLTLAAMWLVNGAGYHWTFFSEINPAAAIFGAVFVLQAALLIFLSLRNADLRFTARRDVRSVVGLMLVLFSAILYPAWGWISGHVWPEMPAFGVAPCPTTIFTIGFLLMGSWRVVRWLLILPGLWAAVGGSAAILLGVPQDFGLLAALALLIVLAVARLAGSGLARHGKADLAS